VDDWLGQLSMMLGDARLSDEEQGLLLDVARDVAHGTERKAAPIAAFLLGAAVARRVLAGEERHAALSASAADLRSLLPKAPPV
jgi:hypothetical protein